MATFSTNLPDLLNPFVTDIFYKQLALHESMYERVFNMLTSNRAYEDTFTVAPLGTLVVKPEGTPIAYDDPIQSDRKRVVHTTYALGFRVTMEMMDDDQHGIIAKMPSDLADAASVHKEVLAWSLFNDAFSGTLYTGIPEGDGTRRALCSASHHLLKTNAVVSNVVTPSAALSVSSIESAVTNFRLVLDQSGRQAALSPSLILHHPSEEFNVAMLLDSQQEPFTTDNQINPVGRARMGLSTLSVPWLTDADTWFMLSAKSKHTIKWYNRKTLEFNNNKDAQTKDALWDCMYRASVTFENWFGVVGSQP